MKSTNKFISFICSLAMISSAFTGIIVANADETETTQDGLVLEYDKAASSSTSAVLNLKIAGEYDCIDSWTAWIDLGDSFDGDSYTVSMALPSGAPFTANNANNDNGICKTNAYGSVDNVHRPSQHGDLLATITITFAEALTSDITATLTGNTNFSVADEENSLYTSYELGKGDFEASSVTILADPDAPTLPPTEDPTPSPEATASPSTTGRPTAIPTEEVSTPLPVVDDGLVLEYDKAASSSTSAVLNLKIAGEYDCIDSWTAWIDLGDSFDGDSYTVSMALPSGAPFTANNANNDNGICKTNAYGSVDNVHRPSQHGDLLATITITFAEALTSDITATLTGNTNFSVADEENSLYTSYELGKGDFEASVVKILADPTAEEPAEPTPFPTDEPEKKASEIATNASEYPSEYDGKQLNGLTVTATTTSGDATYGEDYVAYYDGEELTEAEFSNLINGYNDGVTVDDMINNLSFRANKGVSISIAPAYMDDTTKTTLPGYEQTYENALPATPSPTATAAPTAAPTSTPSGGNQGGNQGGNSGNNNNNNNNNGGNGSGQIARPGTSVTTPGGSVTTVNFQDLDSVPWAKDAINALASSGLINGRSSTVFDPNATVTRAEFTKMICSAFGIASTPNASQTFTDVSPSDWYYGWVQAAVSYGIVNGVSDTAFDPNATIKRQDMATIMYRAIQSFNMTSSLPSGTAKTFADYDQIDDYAKASVTALSSASVINGTSDTTFEPYATATRAQAACIIYQYYQAIGAM